MKGLFYILATGLIVFSGCTKSGNSNARKRAGEGCFERIILNVHDHGISSAEIKTADSLFAVSHIDNSQYRYLQYFQDSVQTYYGNHAKIFDQVVKVHQYVHGMRVFTCQMNFIFQNGVFHDRAGEPTQGTSLDNIPHLQIDRLRALFLGHAEQFEGKGDEYRDSCFKAEFGYYNLNAGISYAPEKLVKAWRVTPKNSVYPSEYPEAFYQDNGELIYYDNGIRTFK